MKGVPLKMAGFGDLGTVDNCQITTRFLVVVWHWLGNVTMVCRIESVPISELMQL